MKFPISMTAGLAGYILKNKMRPRPEWQKTAAPEADAANPFRILSAQDRREAPAASHDPQALSDRADAGAAARLQSHLHRLRPHSRIRIHHHRDACRSKSAWRRWMSAARRWFRFAAASR